MMDGSDNFGYLTKQYSSLDKEWKATIEARRITGHICSNGRARKYASAVCSMCLNGDDIEWDNDTIDAYNKQFEKRIKAPATEEEGK